MLEKTKICIVGLGYVGLPLAVSLSKHYSIVGYDKNFTRIKELKAGIDVTKELSKKTILNSKINFTNKISKIESFNTFIITVPTPVDNKNRPDLKNLKDASKIVGNLLKKENLVIFESTVFPGCTDDILIPILEKQSGLKINKDFHVGYSPERINPGKSKYKLANQVKIVSGSNEKAKNKTFTIYNKIIEKKIHKTGSIKVAEAAKIIENTQRDINIAFINELTILFHKLKINTHEVLAASKTKWNFLNFSPGLVGGHCIGVDPYYLKYKAMKLGLKPKIISSGREVNDFIPKFIFNETRKLMDKSKNKKILFFYI